jgi:serine/threonine protein kinase
MKYFDNPNTQLEPNHPQHDVWSMGVTLYEMLSGGILPFLYRKCPSVFKSLDDTTWVEMRTNLLGPGEVKVEEHMEISAEADSILKSLLNKDIEMRPTANQVMKDRWFLVKGNTLSSTCAANLCFTASKQKARQVILNGLAADMQNDHKTACLHSFQKFDTDHTGTVDKKEFKDALNDMGYDTSHAEEIFDRADVDRTGTLEFNEFVATTFDWRSVDHTTLDNLLTEFLSSLGVNGKDGTISKEGLETLFGGLFPEEDLEELLQQNTVPDMREYVQATSFFS